MNKYRFTTRLLLKLSTVMLLSAIIINWAPSLEPNLHVNPTMASAGTQFFAENLGQVDPSVKFYGNAGHSKIFIEENGTITYALKSEEGSKHAIKETFLTTDGIAAQNPPLGMDNLPIAYSSFTGNDPEKWQSNIPVYSYVSLPKIYKGISVNLFLKGDGIEKVFEVDPHTDPSVISSRLMGTDGLKVNKDGALLMETSSGEFKLSPPVAYQTINGERQNVEVAYRITGENTYGFELGKYNDSLPLTIDPIMASTYLGGAGSEYSAEDNGENQHIEITSDGGTDYIYVTGYTDSSDFPVTPGAYDETPNSANTDTFISKFNLNMTTLVASTVIGGGNNDFWSTIDSDSNGNIFIASKTYSTDYPTTPGTYDDTFDANNGGNDVVISKFNPALTTLLASTYYGGKADEDVTSIEIDGADQVYIAGQTRSDIGDFNGYDTVRSTTFPVYIAKFPNDLSSTGYRATYFEPGPLDPALALAPTGEVFIAGRTTGTMPDAGTPSYQEVYGGGIYDAFVARFDSTLGTYEASTFFGGSYYTNSIATIFYHDSEIFIHMETRNIKTLATAIAANPNTVAITTFCPSGDIDMCDPESAYVAKFDFDLTQASMASIGGSDDYTLANGITVDSNGNVFTIATTQANDYTTTPGAFQEMDPDFYNMDVVISKFSNDLMTLMASTYLGGTEYDGFAHGIFAHSSGNIITSGETASTDFPMSSSGYDTELNNFSQDYFVTALTNDLGADLGQPDAIIDLTAIGGNGEATLDWTEPDDNGYAITGYTVKYKLASSSTWLECNDPSCTDVTPGAVVPGLTNFMTYQFMVYANNVNGPSGPSNIAQATPTPCAPLRDNEDTDGAGPISAVSDSCLGVSVSAGPAYIEFTPDSFNFPNKFSTAVEQDSFSNDNPYTGTVDVYTSFEDILTVLDLRGTGAFDVMLQSGEFTNGSTTIPLENLYVISTLPDTPDLNSLDTGLAGTQDTTNAITYAQGVAPTSQNITSATATSANLSATSTYLTVNQSLDNGPIELMSAATAEHYLRASQALSFYLKIPANQDPGLYSVLFTVDMILS